MLRIWRVLRWVLLALLCVAGGVLLLNSIDDGLDPGAKAMLETPVEEVPRQQNLYYAVQGFNTAGADPEQAGWDDVQMARAELEAGSDPYHLKEDDGPTLQFAGDRTQLPGMGELKSALDFAREHPDQTTRLLQDNRRFLERYDALYAYTRYVDPLLGMAPGRLDIVPLWGQLGLAKRLHTLQLARDLLQVGPATIVAWLQRDNRFWRRMLAEENTGLLGKMVMAAQLRADFILASQLIRLQELNNEQIEALREVAAPLDDKVRNLKGVWKSEFRWSAAMLSRAIRGAPPEDVDATWVDRLTFRFENLFYLPNATLNRRYRVALRLMEIDDHPCDQIPAERAAMLDAQGFAHAPWMLVRNPVGVILADMAGPSYIAYSRRMCNLVGFQRLLGLQILLRQRNFADAEIPAFIQAAGPEFLDPNRGAPMRWLPEARALSFDAETKPDQEFLPWPI